MQCPEDPCDQSGSAYGCEDFQMKRTPCLSVASCVSAEIPCNHGVDRKGLQSIASAGIEILRSAQDDSTVGLS